MHPKGSTRNQQLSGRLVEDYCTRHCDEGASLLHLSSLLGCSSLDTSPLAAQKNLLRDTDRTILMSAAKCGNFTLCRRILTDTNGGINTQNSKGYSCLHFACFNGHQRVASLLLSFGCDVSLRNCYGENAFDSAEAGGYKYLSNVLWNEYVIPPLPSNDDALDALVVPDLVTLNQSASNSKFIHDQNACLWLAPEVANVEFSSDAIPLQTLFLSPLSPLVQPQSDSTFVLKASDVANASIDSIKGLMLCYLEITECDPGCTMSLGTVFRFKDLMSITNDTKNSISFSLGRSRKSNIYIPDLSVSNYHAVLTFYDGIGLCVSDTSKHGTYVNNKKVYHQSSDSNPACKFSFMKHIGDEISVGRVHFVLQKEVNSTISNSFQPNRQFGKQICNAVQQRQQLDSARNKAQWELTSTLRRRQIEQNISDRIEAKQHSITADQRLHKKQKVAGASNDFESSGFVGRSMLANLGWDGKSALGQKGGEANKPVAVTKRIGKGGLGSQTIEAHSFEPSQHFRANIWEKTQSRYKNTS